MFAFFRYSELIEREYDSKSISSYEAKKLLYQSPIFANSIASGTAKNLRNGHLCFEDIKNYHRNYYKPCNIAIIIQGKINMKILQDILDKQLQKTSHKPSPNNSELNAGKIQNDILKEVTVPTLNDELLLVCTWEIKVELMEATKVLLEFFKKNNSVLFRLVHILIQLSTKLTNLLYLLTFQSFCL